MKTATTDAASLLELAAELEDHGARSRSAPAALRLAYAEIRRQAKEPDLFAAASIAQAVDALEADQPRHERAAALEANRQRQRADQERRRRDRRCVSWAKCCGRLYHYTQDCRTHWTACLACKAALVYGPEIPGARAAAGA